MKNILRWALCQAFGKAKGVALTDALLSGPLGELIRNTEEKAIEGVLAQLPKAAASRHIITPISDDGGLPK